MCKCINARANIIYKEGQTHGTRAPVWGVITCLGGLKVAVHGVGLWLWLRQVLHCRKC